MTCFALTFLSLLRHSSLFSRYSSSSSKESAKHSHNPQPEYLKRILSTESYNFPSRGHEGAIAKMTEGRGEQNIFISEGSFNRHNIFKTLITYHKRHSKSSLDEVQTAYIPNQQR